MSETIAAILSIPLSPSPRAGRLTRPETL